MSTNDDENTPLEDALLAAVDHLAVAALELKGAYRFSRQLKVILGVATAVMVLLLGLGVGLTVIALQNRTNGAATRESIATIRDCTTPGGGCYERSRDATGRAVAEIVAGVNSHTDLVFVATIECSHPHRSDAAFERCLHAKGVR